MSTLKIENLVAGIPGKQILNGINLTLNSGEVHAIMGPNGAGKSTLSGVVMGKPGYVVHSGSVTLDGEDLLALPAWQRAQAGLHLIMQYDLSGGEKKRNETLQLALLKPKFAILDELDSGLDIDALRDCARRVEAATQEDNLGVLVITHYARLLEELRPDVVHILAAGKIVKSGGPELADELETTGYAGLTQ
ncbi:MAG: ABC transporter ATP-binding protein [Actinobacteria bacterium]|nr:ABC transporter ATP-binding protein [Actinomycetota bacterium]